MEEEWIKGVFSDDQENEYLGVLHVRKDIKDIVRTGKSILFEDYATEWLEVYMKPHLASTTYNCYRQQMNSYIIPAFQQRDLRTIETVDIQCFFNERRQLKKESQRKLKGILNMIFNAAVDDMIIERNPIQSPRLKLTNQQ